jgi:hypothetical protein
MPQQPARPHTVISRITRNQNFQKFKTLQRHKQEEGRK